MEILLSSIIGYLIGSFPTAYLVLKHNNGLDIRNEGSGNVGTLNSYEVTNSKLVGLGVLIIDIVKGIFSVILVKFLISDQFVIQMISLLFAVFGHCYSVWLKFKGGRGLATAFGGIILLSPIIAVIWFAAWKILHIYKRDIHLANISATIVVIILSIIFSSSLNNLSFVKAETSFIFTFSVSLLMLIILSKHIKPLIDLLNKK